MTASARPRPRRSAARRAAATAPRRSKIACAASSSTAADRRRRSPGTPRRARCARGPPRRAHRAHASAEQPPAAARRPRRDPRLRDRPALAPSGLSQSARPSGRASRARRALGRRRVRSPSAPPQRRARRRREGAALVRCDRWVRRRAPWSSSASPTAGFPRRAGGAQARAAARPGLDRASKGRRGAAEIAPAKPKLTELVGRVCGLSRHVEREEVLAGRLRLRLGLRPPALEPQHLRVVNTTVASPATGEGRALAPLLEARRPFSGATHLLEVAQALIVQQYTLPVAVGRRSPTAAAAADSSINAQPSSTSPAPIKTDPWLWSVSASRSRSANLRAMSSARRSCACASSIA